MSVSLSPIGGAASQFFNGNGVPLTGGKIYTYEAGTTTPKTSFTSANGLTAHSNPIILDATGRVPGGEIWLTSAQAYKFVLKTSSDALVGTYDNIYGISAGAENAVTETQVATAGQTDFVLTSMTYTPGVFTLGVYVDGVNQVVNNAYVETSATTVTFVSGLHVGALVKFININSAATDANVVTYMPAGAGAVATTVQAKLREVVSVKDFGAVGDGATDNAAALQAAVSFALASPFPAIYVPAGSYYTSASIVVQGENADRFKMFGDGRASDIWSDQAVSTLDIKGVSAGGNFFQNPILEFLAIRNTNAAGNAIQTRHTENLRMAYVTVVGASVGLLMSINGGESDIKPQINNCLFAGGVYGIRGGDTRVADAVIRDNIFIDSTGTMMELGYLDGGTINGNKFFSNNAGTNAVVGMRLKKPIYVSCTHNDFFEMGGVGLQLSSPRYSRFNNNRFVNCGQNAADQAFYVFDFTAISGLDVQIIGNTFKDCNGGGLIVTSAGSLQSKYKIQDNYFENVGDAGVIYDAIALVNCTDFEIRKNTVIGNSVTRYWLTVIGSTAVVDDNVHTGVINPDILRSGTNTLKIPMGQRFLTNVTTSQTLTFDDDGVIGGTIVGASITINLPAAQACPGKRYMISKTDASAFSLIIDPASTQTIDGAATLNVNTQYQTVSIISDGVSNWVTTSSN